MVRQRSRGRHAGVVALTVLFAGGVAGCSNSTAPGNRPTEARIRIEGSTPVPLRLVVSTDFFEEADQLNGGAFQVLRSADTIQVTDLPYDQRVPLTTLGSVVVDLANPSVEPAQVRLRVDLDGGQDPYDQSALMSEGGALRYVFAFIQRVF